MPIVGGDFDEGALAAALDHQALNQAAASLYRDRFDNTPGIVYAAGVEHAYNLAQEFRAAGIKAEAVSGRTPPVKLAETLAAYERGEINVLINAMLLAEGWNSPRATVVMHLAPTASKRVYQQRIGRIMRTHPRKEAGIVVDFVPKNATHNERVVSLHSLLDSDFYREGARVTPAPRRRVQRRARRRLTPAPWLVPVTPDVRRRLAVIQREWQRVDPRFLDEDEQRYWATIAARQVRYEDRAEFVKKLTDGRASRACLEQFLATCAAENPNRRLRMTALADRVSMTVERADFDDLVTLVTSAPPWEKDRMQGIRILLRAIAEGHANAPEQIQARWTWKLARASRKVQDRRASAEYPEAKRLLGALANSRGHRHEENAARLVAEALKLPLPVGVALLASAEAYTPRATKLLDAAREEIAPLPEIAAALAENLPAPKATPGRSRRRRRKKKGPQRRSTAAARRAGRGENGAQPTADGEAPPRPKRRRRKPRARTARRRPKRRPPSSRSPPQPSNSPRYPAGAMLLLLGIGFLAGIITALSPCVLPVLPILLAGGATGGRRRPYAIVAGIVASFTVFTLVAAWLLDLLGLPRGRAAQPRDRAPLRARGDADLPPLRPPARAAARAADPAPRRRPRRRLPARREPRARLRAVRRAGARDDLGARGAAQGRLRGRAAHVRLRARRGACRCCSSRSAASVRPAACAPTGSALRRTMGVVVALAALALVFNTEQSLQVALGGYTSALQRHTEATGSAQARLAKAAACAAPKTSTSGYRAAPEFKDIAHWLNTPGDRPLTIAGLRGKVVLVDFWTYSCINCIRTLPHLRAWYAAYHPLGLEIVGVHTPEFAFEHVLGNVRQATHDLHVTWPVALDNDYGTWNAYSNEYWPAEYLIDRSGRVRHVHFGEGDYGGSEREIRSLLAEGAKPLPAAADERRRPHADRAGDARVLPRLRAPAALRRLDRSCPTGPCPYRFPFGLGDDELAYGGVWTVGPQAIVAGLGARLRLHFQARYVYLVLGGQGRVQSLVDGKPAGTVDVNGYRLYTIRSGDDGPERDPRAALRPRRAGLRVHVRLAHCSRAASSSPSSSSRSRRNSVSSAASDSPEGSSSAASIASVRCSSSST